MTDGLIYGPVEGEAFSGVTGVVEPGGIGNITAFDGATFTAKWLEHGRTLAELEQHNGVPSSEIHVLKTNDSEDFSIRVRYGSYYETYIVPPASLSSWGFTYVSTNIGEDIVTLTHQYSPSGTYTATEVTNFYGSVNGEAELANKIYGPVNETVLSGVTGTVRAGSSGISAGIAFDGEVFYNYVKNTIDLTKIPDYLLMHVGRFGETYTLTLYYSDGTFYAFENGSDRINPNLYGITWTEEPQYTGNDYIDLTPVYATNSVAKLIHQGFGHVEYYQYGRVVYYTDSSHTATRTIGLESQSDIDGLCAQSVFYTTWDASVQGISIPNTNIKEVYLTSLVSSIPSNFLYYCTSLDNLDFSHTTITTANPYFVNGCSSLNVLITIPQTLTTISGTFFSHNTSFNQPITLPSGLVSIGYNFFTGNDSMTSPINVGSLSESIILEDTYSSHSFNVSSSSAAYTNGIPIAGSNRAAWIARFPNLSGTWYRKLIDAGY